MRKVLLIGLLSCLCLSGCNRGVTSKVESIEPILATNYILSDSENPNDYIILSAKDFKIDGIEYNQSVKTYITDVSSSRYMDSAGRWDWSYTVSLKDVDGSFGFVVDSEDLYWLYVGRAVDPFDTIKVDVYYSNVGVECIILDDEYLFYSNFQIYAYPEEG